MLMPLVTVGGIIFWLAFFIIILIDIFALKSADDEGWPVAITVAGLVGYLAFTDTTVSWQTIVACLIAYLGCGVAWSFKEWIDFIHHSKEHNLERYNEGDNRTQSFAEWSKDWRPTYKKNKQRIVNWMATWPLLFSWWVLIYPRHFFIWAAKYLSVKFDAISDSIWNS